MVYQRVTFKPEGAKRSQSVILRDPTTSGWAISGIEVGRDGDTIEGKDFDERLRIIDLDLVSKRIEMIMDLHYAVLVTK